MLDSCFPWGYDCLAGVLVLLFIPGCVRGFLNGDFVLKFLNFVLSVDVNVYLFEPVLAGWALSLMGLLWSPYVCLCHWPSQRLCSLILFFPGLRFCFEAFALRGFRLDGR